MIGDVGFTFTAGDVLDQGMLTTLLPNAVLRHKKGERALQRIRQHFLLIRVNDGLGQLYADLAGEPLHDGGESTQHGGLKLDCLYYATGSSLAVKCRKNGASYSSFRPRMDSRLFQTSRIISTT